MEIFGKTDIGLIRQQNQDSFSIGSVDDSCRWGIVCDGMGGAAGGDIASTIACDTASKLISNLYKSDMSCNATKNLLESIVITANSKILESAMMNRALMGMGTTIVLSLVINDVAHIIHVGDSRAYKISNDSCIQLTKDHSYVQEMVDMGRISEKEAKNHPHRNYITRALGINNKVIGEYDCTNLEKDDIILLCTDGISNLIEKDEMLLLSKTYKRQELADKMIELANNRGGYDNSTAVLIYNEMSTELTE